jgi:alpha-beta hydrolase superfamily lysophospholipase
MTASTRGGLNSGRVRRAIGDGIERALKKAGMVVQEKTQRGMSNRTPLPKPRLWKITQKDGSDLVAEINIVHGQRPVLFGVSFGAGLILEWLRRTRLAGRNPALGGTILVSPVACAADIVSPDEPKPSTLIGRALKPYLDAANGHVAPGVIEKSRVIFTKMFESGAQNKASLRALMSAAELRHLHSHVIAAIQSIDYTGACERLSALRQFPALSAWDGGPRPLSDAPALVLYAEKEGAVLHEGSPTRAALASTLSAFFPRGRHCIVAGGSSPVQHASLIFHYFQFLTPITAFYRGLKARKDSLAA